MAHRSETAGFAGRGRGVRISLITGAIMICFILVTLAMGGPYLESAHGDADGGVNRGAIDVKFEGYATGNCAHCHEMHASLDGVESAPQGGAAPHGLFANNFNTTRTEQMYLESDNFCFSCHSYDAGQRVVNQDYSGTFGGAISGSGPQSIFEAFNQESYHNLYDIWNLLRNNPAFPAFKDSSNPCSACHNSHLAKSNKDGVKPAFPLLSAISKPNDHSRLWGETELMSAHVSYEAPFAFDTSREPAGVGDFDGDKTPDYVGFCITCHTPLNIIWSTSLNREVRKINWGTTGEKLDKHGARVRDSQHPDSSWGQRFAEPYNTTLPFKNNLVLSCLDCHEPHGSANIMLLRRRVNGGDLTEVISELAPKPLLPLCIRCHNREYVNLLHHEPGYLEPTNNCSTCHPNGESDPEIVACRQCHFHGSNL